MTRNPQPCSLPHGRVVLRALRSDPTQEYLVFIPSSGPDDARVMVTVHGTSRNVFEHVSLFAPGCEELGVMLVAPIFTSEQNKDYQRLGRRGGCRSDFILNRCLAEAALLSGADVTQISLFGFSGGAQFAHRYVMAHPERVAKAVVVAAGWYTFPDHRQRYPYGIRPNRSFPDVNFNPERFLKIPIEVLVGARDVKSTNLRATERVNKQQGFTRVERARNWVKAMQTTAETYSLDSRVRLVEVPEIDHSFQEFCLQGGLVERAFTFLCGNVAEVQGRKSQAAGPAPEREESK